MGRGNQPYRDKARIRPFLDEFAALWEKYPQLRFGQIIASLPYYADRDPRRRDITSLEEDEMAAVVRRYFESSRKKVEQNLRDRLEQIRDGWQETAERLSADNAFSVPDFKELFRETWRYFADNINPSAGLRGAEVDIVSCISALRWHSAYPTGVKEWEYEACCRYAEALLYGIENPDFGYHGGLYGGYLVVSVTHGSEEEVHIGDFDRRFDELAEYYRTEEFEEE